MNRYVCAAVAVTLVASAADSLAQSDYVDDTPAGSSNWSTGTSAADKYGSDYKFRSTAPVSDLSIWSINVPATGDYDIFAWWPAGTNRSQTASYTLPNGAVATRDQQTAGGSWQLLGTQNLSAGIRDTKLSCWTTTGFVVIADAVKYHGPKSAPGIPPIWVGNYDAGNLSQFQNASWNYVPTAATVVSSPRRDGSYAAKYVIPAGGQRCETVPNTSSFREGDDRWFSFSIMFGSDVPMNTSWQVLTQWKNDGTGSPPLEISIGENTSNLRVGGGYGHPSGPRSSHRDIMAAQRGVWSDFLVHVKFSSNPSIGVVDVWVNGVQRVAGYRPTGGTLYPGLNSYWKNGYYRSSSINQTGTIYQDTLKVGTTRSSVER